MEGDLTKSEVAFDGRLKYYTVLFSLLDKCYSAKVQDSKIEYYQGTHSVFLFTTMIYSKEEREELNKYFKKVNSYLLSYKQDSKNKSHYHIKFYELMDLINQTMILKLDFANMLLVKRIKHDPKLAVLTGYDG